MSDQAARSGRQGGPGAGANGPARLCVHHVGGRFGTASFPVLPAFDRDLVSVFYDADADCIDQIKEKHRNRTADVRVLPVCLGEVDGPGTFIINYDPTTSSRYRYNRDYASFSFYCYTHDFIIAENMRPMEERSVQLVTLDSVIADERRGVPPPDLLSIDAQGSEHDILRGAERTLDRHVLAIVAETVFHPLYEGEKTFGEIQQYLAERGFQFARFLSYIDYSPYRKPVGLRGEAFHVSNDALFLRRIDSIERTPVDDGDRHVMLRKLAFLAMVYNQFEYGVECLERSRAGRERHAAALEGMRYAGALREIEEAIDRMPKRYPATFSEKYSFDLSKRRFFSLQRIRSDSGPGKAWWQRGLDNFWLKVLYPRVHTLVRGYDLVVRRLWAPLAARILPSTPVERVLKRYGLRKQALVLKKNRLAQPVLSGSRAPRNAE